MNDNIKTSLGLLVPFSSLAFFVYFSLLGNFLAAILAAIGGVMFWFLYSLVMESKMPDIIGNMVILFGGLLTVAFFLNYGVSKNMFGGFNISLEGTAASAIILFFSVLLGVSLRNQIPNSIKSRKLETPISLSADPLVNESMNVDANNDVTSEPFDENYSYYDPSEYEYPDSYDYEYDDDYYDPYEEEE